MFFKNEWPPFSACHLLRSAPPSPRQKLDSASCFAVTILVVDSGASQDLALFSKIDYFFFFYSGKRYGRRMMSEEKNDKKGWWWNGIGEK